MELSSMHSAHRASLSAIRAKIYSLIEWENEPGSLWARKNWWSVPLEVPIGYYQQAHFQTGSSTRHSLQENNDEPGN